MKPAGWLIAAIAVAAVGQLATAWIVATTPASVPGYVAAIAPEAHGYTLGGLVALLALRDPVHRPVAGFLGGLLLWLGLRHELLVAIHGPAHPPWATSALEITMTAGPVVLAGLAMWVLRGDRSAARWLLLALITAALGAWNTAQLAPFRDALSQRPPQGKHSAVSQQPSAR